MIYTYLLSEQPNSIWCHNKLLPEFVAEVNKSDIQQNIINGISLEGEKLEINFQDYISDADWEKLDLLVRKNLVADCDKTMLRIYNYIPETADFLRVDYDLLGFKKERIVEKGELRVINYYANRNEEEGFSNLVIREENTYKRDQYGYISTRDKIITWIHKDDTDGPMKHTVKKYSLLEAAACGEEIRKNKIASLKAATVGLIMRTQQCNILEAEQIGGPFLASVIGEVAIYQQGMSVPLLTAIQNATFEWLDTPIGGGATIRLYLLNELQ